MSKERLLQVGKKSPQSEEKKKIEMEYKQLKISFKRANIAFVFFSFALFFITTWLTIAWKGEAVFLLLLTPFLLLIHHCFASELKRKERELKKKISMPYFVLEFVLELEDKRGGQILKFPLKKEMKAIKNIKNNLMEHNERHLYRDEPLLIDKDLKVIEDYIKSAKKADEED
ncbi:MAG: hypothetical protein PHY40_02025 [Patescibacteria group bacterium]|nr:hypothetical protein [Patescibacteria group bacterium]